MLTTTATELPRLIQCIGSRLMPPALPADYDTSQRDEGNAAHWLAQTGCVTAVGSKAPNGYVITDDMMEHVRTYLDALHAGGQMEVETTFGTDRWEVRARTDHIVYHDGVGEVLEPSTLVVDDFKYGWRLVEPDENWTLIAHAIGWCIRNNVWADRYVLRIHQPRPYHPSGPTREWVMDHAALARYYEAIDARLSNPTDTLTTGLAQCAKCHALATCPAARAASMNAIDVVQGMAFVDDLPNEALAHEYEVLDQAEKMVEAVRDARKELMEYRLSRGQVIPGWHLKHRQGNRAWHAGLSGRALTAASGVDLTKDGVVTPAEAERRGVPKAVVAALTDRPSLGVKLERLDADAMGKRLFGER